MLLKVPRSDWSPRPLPELVGHLSDLLSTHSANFAAGRVTSDLGAHSRRLICPLARGLVLPLAVMLYQMPLEYFVSPFPAGFLTSSRDRPLQGGLDAPK
jgi:hypothetical protein